MAVEIFGRGETFVRKITGRVDRPLQRIREFRNRPSPGIVVTVDLLSTGVDIPDLEFIVFLRSVQSRILFEQMLGRGTRKGEHHTDKSHFTVFDCFDGTLVDYFKNTTSMTTEPPVKPSRTIEEIIDDIWDNRDREYNVRCLVKRLQRIDKEMAGEARDDFAAYGIPNGDLAQFASKLPQMLKKDFTGTMKLFRDKGFQRVLVDYKRREKLFLRAIENVDQVSSEYLIRDGKGNEHKPEDYLNIFARFIRENPSHIEAVQILLERPSDWSTEALKELKQKLTTAPERFTEEALEKAHKLRYQKALVDIISMVKHAASQQNPLLTADERAERAIKQISEGRTFTDEQQQWLERIKLHLARNLSIERDDFDTIPALEGAGGWGKANKVFDGKLFELVQQLNKALSEQQEIVRRVEKLFAFADQIESRLKQAQAQVDRLTQSILAKAFRGELVPTEAELARRENRPYESAAELLKRIVSASSVDDQAKKSAKSIKPKSKKSTSKSTA